MEDKLKSDVMSISSISDFNEKDIAKALSFIKKQEIENPLKELTVIINGEPKAWKRHRASSDAKGGIHFYDPNTSTKGVIQLYLENSLPENFSPIQGEVTITGRFYRSIPKSIPNYKRILMLSNYLKPVSTPDLDNYIKNVQDAFNKIAFRDDAQIVWMDIDKRYSDKPRIELTMSYRQHDMRNGKL